MPKDKRRFLALLIVACLFCSAFLSLRNCTYFNLPKKEYLVPNVKLLEKRTFLADILPFTSHPDPAAINSAGDYILTTHLVRSFVKLSKNLQIEGDLATRWEIDRDFMWYKFYLDKNAKFSNGELITSQDVKRTIERCKQLGKAIHFKFSEISEIIAEKTSITIKFKSPQYDFLYQANKPEFGVLYKTDYEAPLGNLKFTVSSGPYTLEKPLPNHMDKKTLILKKNINYPFFGKSAPSVIGLQFSSDEDKVQQFAKGALDFAVPLKAFDQNLIKFGLKDKIKKMKPHIGFTYWLSINSKRITDPKKRSSIQNILRGTTLKYDEVDETWTGAEQLYLPLGPSRLNQNEVSDIWSVIKSFANQSLDIKSLTILLDKNYPLNDQLIKKLELAGIKLNIKIYESQSEFSQILQNEINQIDLFLTNNDFSSFDLMENVKVSFNQTRPLILIDGNFHSIHNSFEKAQSSQPDERQRYLKSIGKELLVNGLIVPLSYRQLFFYFKDGFSFEEWSSLYPEISFWKIEAKD